MKKEVIAHKDPKSPISEVFRTLRTNIQFMNVNKKLKVLLVTSTFPGEGKSWTASNLAVTFAQAGKRVVLIDSDMRKGRTYAIFGISPKPGLSNFLSETEVDEATGRLTKDVSDYIQATEVENLYVMTAGSVPPNPSELLVSMQMKQMLNELRTLSDIIIIDGTPSELVTDSVILSRIADSTVIVTAHKVTKKDALERVVKNIKNVGGHIAGVVINKVPVSAKKYGEKYYYYGSDKSTSKNGKKSRRITESNSTHHSKLNTERVTNKNEDDYHNSSKYIKNESFDGTQNTSDSQDLRKKSNDIMSQMNTFLEKEKKEK